MNSRQKGLLGETKAMSALVARGYGISVPIAAESYDFIARKEQKTYWVQAKYCGAYKPPFRGQKRGPYVRSRLKVNYKSWHRGGPKHKRIIDFNVVDLVTVYLPQVDQVAFFNRKMLSGKDELSININDEKSKNYYKRYTNPKWL